MNTINTLRAVLVLLVLAFLGVIGSSLQDRSAREGGPAPGFSLMTDQGKQVTPTSFGGKVLILNFWATWCTPCVQEIPSLNVFQKQFGQNGIVVVAVSVDKSEQKYKNFLGHIPVTFETARDPKADLSTQYGTFQFPETYIIKDGRILKKYAEAKDWTGDDVTQYVKSLL